VNAQDGEYGNALQAASSHGHKQTVQILLDRGAKINAQDEDYDNALQATSLYGHEQIMQVLLDRGAEVNAQDEEYGNALQATSSKGHEKVIQVLLDRGAKVNAQDEHYGNALQATSSEGHEKVVQLNLFPDLKIVGVRLGNDVDVKHDAQVDRDSVEPLDAAVVSQSVLVRVASDVLGLAEFSPEAGNERAEDHEVKRTLMAEVLMQVSRSLNF